MKPDHSPEVVKEEHKHAEVEVKDQSQHASEHEVIKQHVETHEPVHSQEIPAQQEHSESADNVDDMPEEAGNE